MDGTAVWAVARTKSGCEDIAAENLKNQSIPHYLPKFVDQRTQRKRILFPNYIFVSIVDEWRRVRSTRGILDFLMAGDAPGQIQAHEMRNMKSREIEAGLLVLEPYKQDQPVIVKRGPAKDQLAVFDGMTSAERCRVLLGWLKVELPVRDLVAA